MQQRQLGADGASIPVLMFGAWPIAGGLGAVDEATAQATIRRALDRGIIAIDTAEYYRDSESILGRTLQGRARDSYFLATKVSAGPYTRARIREALEQSLRALRLDYVDLYQLHSYPTGVSLEESMAGIAEAQERGLTRYVGVSNFTVEELAAAHALHPVHSLQPRLNIFDSEAAGDLVPYCHAHGIGVIAHTPLAKGLLTGKYRPDYVFPPDDERRSMRGFRGEPFRRYLAAADELAGIAREKGCTLTQLAIAWTLAHPGVTSSIVGAKTPEQVDEHVGGAEVTLTPDEMARIAAIAAPIPGPTY